MQDLQVKKQSFDRAKNQLLEFSKNLPKTPQLEKFKEDTLWGALSRNVTGKEMNEFVVRVQSLFIQTNETSTKIIKEFNDVYKVFETLDKEYIAYFESSINNLLKVNEKAQDAQKDVDSALKVLKATIEKLNEYKSISSTQINSIENRLKQSEIYLNEKLDQLNKIEEIKANIEKYEHFNDIDDIWEDVQGQKEQIQSLMSSSQSFSDELVSFKQHVSRIEAIKHIQDVDATWEEVQDHAKEIQSIVGNLKNLNALKNKIEGIAHLFNMDEIWNSVEELKVDIPKIQSELEDQNKRMQILNSHKDQVNSIVHFKDVDQLWEDNLALQKEVIEIKSLYQEMEQKSSNSILELANKNKVLEELIKKNEIKSNSKITYAYIVGGLAILLAIIHLILNFAK